ncbi:DUF2235 domain-containing protein [Bradyrhizobium sp. UFLA05-112]
MPRRIVLLSDGTGNSAAQVWRTNVWRLFCALDLSNDDQVAFYDDGVGTSSFKPLALLGGAFGIGLRRNVRELYKFACRNHRGKDDQIFGFGFSRGAFTIRVLTGLILDQGLIDASSISEEELDRQARQAYRDYQRKHFHTNWYLLYQGFRKLIGRPILAWDSEVPARRHAVEIRFLGLWDTVAAYGLPIDEMTRGVSQWIWPLELPNHTLGNEVKRACHALSLDDERTTFHPILWNERDPEWMAPAETEKPGFTASERIVQVWFCGVHANVGGGYPDDSLAQIPLCWIMEEARACGLKFKTENPAALAEVRQAQDKDGRLYDPRSGFGAYYRYGPRRLSRLCDQRFSRTTGDEVYIERPKIHETALRRIKNNAHVYAPIGIPHEYDIVMAKPVPHPENADYCTFEVKRLPTKPGNGLYETASQAAARVSAERKGVWPRVYLRAALYFSTLAATAFAIIFPLAGRGNSINADANPLGIVSDIIRTASGFVPGWASGWLSSYADYPFTFCVLALVLTALLYGSSRVASSVTGEMQGLWKKAFDEKLTPVSIKPERNPKSGLLFVQSIWKYYVGPAISAAILAYLTVTVAAKFLLTAVDQAGLICEKSAAPTDIPDGGVLISFDASKVCHATGYKIGRLDRYFIWTTPDPGELKKQHPNYKDDHAACTQPGVPLGGAGVTTDGRGYSTFGDPADATRLSWYQMALHVLKLPLRRYYGEPWFQPIARYGQFGDQVDFLEPDPNPAFRKISEYVSPKVPGELIFYVNEAALPVPQSFQWFYNNHQGCISFFVKPSK